MLFEGRGKGVADELKRAAWTGPEERQAFVERVAGGGDFPMRSLVPIVRDSLTATDGRTDEILLAFHEIIARAGKAEHIPAVADLLRLAAGDAREQLAATLTVLPLPDAPEPVVDLLKSDKREIRQCALEILAGKRSRSVFEALVRTLGQSGWNDRAEAIEALVRIGEHRAVDPLRSLLLESGKSDREEVLRHLTDLCKHEERGDRGKTVLRDALETDDGELQLLIASALGEVGDPEDAPRLSALLQKADRRHEQTLIRALGNLRCREAIPALLPFLRSNRVGVRLDVLAALSSFADEEVLEHLIEALRDDELLVRQKAVEILGELGRSPHVRLGRMLVLMMRDRDVNVRRAVIEVIRAIGEEEEKRVWAKLISYVKDEDWWVRESVTEVLCELGGEAILTPMLSLLDEPNELVRRYAVEVLVKIGDPSVIPRMIDATRDPDWWVRERAVEALAALEAHDAVPHLIALVQEDEELRWAGVQALGSLGDSRAVDVLLEFSSNDPPEFRLVVLDALHRISGPDVLPRLDALLADADHRVRHRALQLVQRFESRTGTFAQASEDPFADLSPIDRYLLETRERGGADLFTLAGQPPMMKHRGEVVPLREEKLANEQIERMLIDITSPAQHGRFFDDGEDLDFSYSIPGHLGRYRVNVYRQWTGLAATFRVIPHEILSLSELGLPPIIEELCRLRTGLVLVTGPTASGKSTTLAAMIDHINRTRTEHIITVEDPIEYVHPNIQCVINQREVGVHTMDYAEALRGALRQDPDVILVGEMRDHETVSTALTAAETGHLVLGTLHTVSAAKTVDRVIDVFPPRYQAQVRTMLSESLRAVMSQHLIPRADEKGMALALEVMVVNEAISNLIRKEKAYQIPSVLATTAEIGNQLMDNQLMKLVKRSVITPEEGYSKAENKREFEPFLPNPGDVEGQLAEQHRARHRADGSHVGKAR